MSHVFISYSRQDKEFVERLVKDLSDNRITYWFDQEGIRPGNPDWDDELHKAVRNCHTLLWLVSSASSASKYVKHELELAQSYDHPIIPLWIEGAKWIQLVPFGFGKAQYIDLRSDLYDTSIQKVLKILIEKESLLKKQESRDVSKELVEYQGLGWGNMKTLTQHPYLLTHKAGWIPSKVLFHHTGKFFEYSDEDQGGYEKYYKENYKEKRFDIDRTKLMLDRIPVIVIDQHKLELRTREVKYSQIQYTVDNLSNNEGRRKQYIDNTLTNIEIPIDFAHVISLFVLILSNEDEILLARRSSRVVSGYHPGKWQVSISEQFEIKDLFDTAYDPTIDDEVIDKSSSKPDYSVIPEFFKRALKEELNIHTGIEGKTDDYKVDDARILSLFLEADILNVGICSYIKLDIPSSEVLEIARDHAYSNPQELDKFEMLPVSKVEKELLDPSYEYHPASQYMLYMYLLHIGDEDTRLRIDERLKDKKS